MALVELKAILWRRVLQATFDTLKGLSPGQYHIALTTATDIEAFFTGLPQRDPTDLGGYEVDVPIASFEGTPPVDPTTLVVRYMGPRSERKDWYIRAQRPETAYPLWREGRGVPAAFNGERRDFVLLLRDVHDQVHARWIADEHFDSLPEQLRNRMIASQIGVMKCPP